MSLVLLPYLALLGIPVGICTLVYLAFSLLRKQRENRWVESCEKFAETTPVNGQVTYEDYSEYLQDVLAKAAAIIKEEASDEAFYRQVSEQVAAKDREAYEASMKEVYASLPPPLPSEEIQIDESDIMDLCDQLDELEETSRVRASEVPLNNKKSKPKKPKKKSKKRR